MKTRPLSLLVAAVLLVVTPVAPAASFYFTADAGVLLTDDVDAVVPQFGPPVATTFNLDPGIRFQVGVGYRLTDWFAVELQSGAAANNFDALAGSGMINQMPILLNGVFRKKFGAFEPFVGAGAGTAASFVAFDNAILTPAGPVLDGTEVDMVFAWQLYGGLDYRFNESMAVGLVYRFIAAGDSDWDVSGLGTISAEGTTSHTIGAHFSLEF